MSFPVIVLIQKVVRYSQVNINCFLEQYVSVMLEKGIFYGISSIVFLSQHFQE